MMPKTLKRLPNPITTKASKEATTYFSVKYGGSLPFPIGLRLVNVVNDYIYKRNPNSVLMNFNAGERIFDAGIAHPFTTACFYASEFYIQEGKLQSEDVELYQKLLYYLNYHIPGLVVFFMAWNGDSKRNFVDIDNYKAYVRLSLMDAHFDPMV